MFQHIDVCFGSSYKTHFYFPFHTNLILLLSMSCYNILVTLHIFIQLLHLGVLWAYLVFCCHGLQSEEELLSMIDKSAVQNALKRGVDNLFARNGRYRRSKVIHFLAFQIYSIKKGITYSMPRVIKHIDIIKV